MRALFAAVVIFLAGCGTSSTPPQAPRPVSPGAVASDAIAALLRLEDRREFDSTALAAATSAEQPEIRRRAALAIGRLRNPVGLPLLTPLLADPDSAVAASAAFAIGLIGDTVAVPVLVSVVRNEMRPTVVGEAAAALGKLHTVESRSALRAVLEATPTDDANPWLIGQALLAIWKHPRVDDLEPIFRWTRSDDPYVRWRAAYALVRRPTPMATGTLMTLAEDTDPAVRAIAIRGLTAPMADTAGIESERVVDLLLAAVDADAYRVRVNAVRALGTFDTQRSVETLARLLRSDSTHLAWSAAESLGRLGASARSASTALRQLAVDTTRPAALRAAGLDALALVMPTAAAEVAQQFALESEWRLRAAAAGALARVGPHTRPDLANLVRDDDPRVSAAAVAAAVEAAGDSMAMLRPLLLEAAGYRDVMVRANALAGLEKLADPATLSVLLDAFGRAQADTLNDAALAAVAAIAALRDAGVPAARTFALRFPRSDDPIVRQRVADLLGPAVAEWGESLPIETGLTPADYRRVVGELVVPSLSSEDTVRVRIETEPGSIELELFAADAPLTVRNFLRLAEAGYFNGQQWPRVVPNFVVQGGDPRGDTSGGPGWAIRDEINRHRYVAGTLGMALAGPDTGGSQFFITHSPQPHLDGGYTVFGRVVAGADVAHRILPGDTIYRIVRLP